MKIFYITFFTTIASLMSCYSDKGNYNYSDDIIFTFQNLETEYNVLGNAERLVIDPKIISSKDGEIKADNPNFEFEYLNNVYNKETGRYWTTVSNGLKLDTLAEFTAGTYQFLLAVKDKRSGVTEYAQTKVVVGSPTYEGWMLLGTSGADNKTRLDMVSILSATREIVAYNLMQSRGLPEGTKGANCIGFYPNVFNATMDQMYLATDMGTYLIEKNEFTTSEKSTINYTSFINPDVLKDNIKNIIYNSHMLLVTSAGDAFARVIGPAGARFLDPINTFVRSEQPSFKVSPFIGHNAKRPNLPSGLAIFFDLDNKRFLGWSSTVSGGGVMFELINPSGAELLFDYNTNSELIYMEGTGFDGGVSFALLKDNSGNYNIAGMLATSSTIKQHSYYPNIAATNISQAKNFTFHSMFPLMFYNVGSDVFCYNYTTKVTNKVLSLPGEEITVLKFHPFKGPLSGYNALNKSDAEFMNLPNRLNVASYKTGVVENGGFFRIYNIDATAMSVEQYKSYSGLCRIADVMYRERRAQFN